MPAQSRPKCYSARIPCKPVWLEVTQGEGRRPRARAVSLGSFPVQCTAPSTEGLPEDPLAIRVLQAGHHGSSEWATVPAAAGDQAQAEQELRLGS